MPKTRDTNVQPKPQVASPLPKEEVGRWESEGGAPVGGRNPTAIKEGQNREPQPAAHKKPRRERSRKPC